MTVETCKCLRCGHGWIPRSEKKPLNCPRCHSPYWNVPRKAREPAKEPSPAAEAKGT